MSGALTQEKEAISAWSNSVGKKAPPANSNFRPAAHVITINHVGNANLGKSPPDTLCDLMYQLLVPFKIFPHYLFLFSHIRKHLAGVRERTHTHFLCMKA